MSEDNPYSEAPQKDYGPDDQEETKQEQPQYSAIPTGFGAERDMLQQEYVSIPETAQQSTLAEDNRATVRGQSTIADVKMKEASKHVRNDLITEINAFAAAAEATGASTAEGFEDQDLNNVFSVVNPIKMSDTAGLGVGSVIKYTVIGNDNEGRFEIQRRYNEFLALNNALNDRWPGCYVPAIPEKQLIGDKEDGFVEERRQLLERFIRECSKYKFLTESKEFKIFSRSPGEITETLEKLPKQTPSQILEKYRSSFPMIQEESAPEMARYRERINVFSNFLTKCQQSNVINRDSMINSVKEHKQHAANYKDLYAVFMQYEDSAVEFFSENDMNARVLTHPKAGDLKERIATSIQAFKNPFLEAALWIKGEMLDIQGMINAMRTRENVMKRQLATESKKRSDQEELEKMSLGKATLKSFFKSKDSKEKDILNLQAAIEQANVDIEEYRKLMNFITVYQGHYAVEKFKADKTKQYARMLYLMSVRSITNAGLFAQLSAQILELQEN